MSAEENKALIRRYFEEIDAAARGKRDASVLDEFLAPDFVDHDPSPGFAPDSEGLKQAHEHFLAATPDGYHIVEDMIAEGDKVMTRVSAYGTQTGLGNRDRGPSDRERQDRRTLERGRQPRSDAAARCSSPTWSSLAGAERNTSFVEQKKRSRPFYSPIAHIRGGDLLPYRCRKCAAIAGNSDSRKLSFR